MFRALAILASIIGASAFAPAGRMARSSSALKMSFSDEAGALAPVGFWDPLGLSANIDKTTFDNYRAAELKHGRVAMLAVVGYLVQESVRLPGTIDLDGTTFASIPNGVGAIGAISSLGWLQIVASIGYWELVGWEDKRPAGGEVGDFGFGSYTDVKAVKSADDVKAIRTKELQNGRLAMLAIFELLTHDLAKPAGEGLFVLHHF